MGRRSRTNATRRGRRCSAAAAAATAAILASSSSSSSSCTAAAVAAAAAFSPSFGGGGGGRHHHRRNNFARAPAASTSSSLGAYTDGGDDRSSRLPPDIVGAGASSSSGSDKPVEVLPNGGRVTLVGSGPGDPNLLTVAAHALLLDPSCLVLADRLVSSEILSLIGGEVRVADKVPGCQHAAQDELYRWVREGLDAGRHVVRLKIGDPFVFGRGGEEVLEVRGYGVEPRVIPGVSAAFSAPLLGSIPVTHRGVANQVVLCTGYGRDNTSPDLIRYHPEQTVVFLMAVGRLRQLSARLIDLAGYPGKTPVGIVERAGCPEQRTVVGTLEDIGDIAEKYDVKPPSTIVVGEVVRVLLEEDESGESVVGLVQNATAGAELV